jgi:hypothetical protein
MNGLFRRRRNQLYNGVGQFRRGASWSWRWSTYNGQRVSVARHTPYRSLGTHRLASRFRDRDQNGPIRGVIKRCLQRLEETFVILGPFISVTGAQKLAK